MTDVRKELLEHLRLAKVSGLPDEWFTSEAVDDISVQPDAAREPAKGVVASDVRDSNALAGSACIADSPPIADKIAGADILQLRVIAEECKSCRLCEGRNKMVFGVGKTDSPCIAFVGEGPGADEDRAGEPFVGRAGQLLTAAINKGLGLNREDVYICNVVKCRPPENRAPLPDEVVACTRFLYRQLELIRPKVIVTLGQPAQLALSGVKGGITKIRGQWQAWRGIKLMPTFHPAYLLRNPSAKREFWDDLQAVMRELGMPVSRAEEGEKR